MFLSVKEFKITVHDVGKLLKTEYQASEFKIPKTYDLTPIWGTIIGRKKNTTSRVMPMR